MTEPGSASACARAARLGTSPKISPEASTTTGPESIATRAASAGVPEPVFFRFNSASGAAGFAPRTLWQKFQCRVSLPASGVRPNALKRSTSARSNSSSVSASNSPGAPTSARSIRSPLSTPFSFIAETAALSWLLSSARTRTSSASLINVSAVTTAAVNTLVGTDDDGAYIRVLVDPMYWLSISDLPRTFEGYRVVVENRELSRAFH
jgi:hypothetical protein